MILRKNSLTITLLLLLPVFLNCKSPEHKDIKTIRIDSLNNPIIKSTEKFNNRPVHSSLTAEVIDNTSDEDLLQTVFDDLTRKLPKDYEKEKQTVLGWTKSQQAIYVIWVFEGEVNNGGFNQFYYNSSGQFADLVPGALRLIGANRFADLAGKANKTYLKEYKRITKYQDGSTEGFSKSYEDNPLDKFDDTFYGLYKKENLQQLQVDFVRRNKQDFIGR